MSKKAFDKIAEGLKEAIAMQAWDGIPRNPDRDGWHWVREGDDTTPEFWAALHQMWLHVGDAPACGLTPEQAAPDLTYLGPVATPAEVARLREELRECGSALYCATEALKWARLDMMSAKAGARAIARVERAIDDGHAAQDNVRALLDAKEAGE